MQGFTAERFQWAIFLIVSAGDRIVVEQIEHQDVVDGFYCGELNLAGGAGKLTYCREEVSGEVGRDLWGIKLLVKDVLAE